MSRSTVPRTFIEPLEARIAPAALIAHHLADLIAGSGKTGATIDLSHLLDSSTDTPNRSHVRFITNFDTDTTTPGLQAGEIVLELYDDLTPLTVQNFLSYLNNTNPRGDYDGTFFHRSFDFGAGSGAGNDIVQGGGFEATDIRTHILTALELHNEYREDLPNAVGTIAMAKTGLSPNTATSEFFFNVNDNSSILGSGNNGGFTVFGKVISGFDLVTKIAAAAKSNQGGALTDLPVQNYNADPDSNPFTPPPAVKPDNLITITDAKLEPVVKGDVTGITYAVTVTDATAAHGPSDLLTATVSGSDLNLQYAPGKSGVATVKVSVTKDGMTEDEAFDVTVKPNLVANIGTDALPALLIPSVTPKSGASELAVKLGNSGAANLSTKVDVKFYLSKIGTPSDPNGTMVDADDQFVGQLLNQSVSIPGGGTTLITTTNLNLPSQLLDLNFQNNYRLIADVKLSAGSALDQLFTDDDNAIDGGQHKIANVFGTFTDQAGVLHKNVGFTYTEADSDVVKFTMKGAGFGEITIANGLADLRANGTNASSVLTAKTAANHRIELHGLDVSSQIGGLALGQADFSGPIAISAGAKSIVLGNVHNDSKLSIGTFAPANTQTVAITLGNVQDLRLDSLMPIRTLTAVKWLDTTGEHDAVSAVSVGAIRITGGAFQADVSTSSDAPLASFSVSGLVENSTIHLNGALGTLKASGLRQTTIQTQGDVRSVTVGSLDSSQIFVGAQSLPNSLANIGDHALGSLTVRGLFTDSQVSAERFGTINLQAATAPTGGFIADAIKSYNRTGRPPLRNLDAPGTFDPLAGYKVTVV